MPSIRRERPRKHFTVVNKDIVDRVKTFFDNDNTARSTEKELRIQRYAKFRMWTEGGKTWPWEDASDIALPDMMEKSLRVQDTIHNAVMSSRPVIGAHAQTRADADKERAIDELIDYQVFVEQQGEETVGDLADAFVNDGVAFVFLPWVKELRKVSDVRRFDPIPVGVLPMDYFNGIIQKTFGQVGGVPTDTQGWDWQITEQGRTIELSFYTGKDGAVEMVRREEAVVYDGPRMIQKEWDEVLYPARAANLQAPSPSNPHGAAHLILVDYPTVDEVRRLARQGIYDQLTDEQLEELEVTATDTSDNQEMRKQKDTLSGTDGEHQPDKKKTPRHKTVTRLLCFDIMDIDGDGQTEDVVWWVIKDIDALARRELMTEVFPSNPPRRPIRHKAFLPVRGRVAGIGLLEMMEGLHDAMKMVLDQTVDAGTIANAPFGFYRPSGSMKPEIIRMAPGELYPLQDPSRDVSFPSFANRDQTFGFNLFNLLNTSEEKLTTVGDLQLGRVPEGKASALRTVGGQALIAAQGEARPERILRRFFSLLKEVWQDIHGLNQNFLPETKKIRVMGLKQPGEDPYREIARADVSGIFMFDFRANVLNTSKLALQQSIQALMGVYVSEIAIQLGIINGEGIYRLFRKFGFAQGQDPDEFLKPPSPDSMLPPIFAEEALVEIMNNGVPDGQPAEAGGAIEHLQKLQAIIESDQFGFLTEPQLEIFRAYVQKIMERSAAQQKQQQVAAAAQGFGQEGQPVGRPPTTGPQDPTLNAPLQAGELRDETLPGARGGAA